MAGFHFTQPNTGWPEAADLLPDYHPIKAVDNVQMLAEAKSINPWLDTILRHWYTAQVPDSWPESEAGREEGEVIREWQTRAELAWKRRYDAVWDNLEEESFPWLQVPEATLEGNKQRARDFFSTFIDGTFLEGSTAGWNHAAATNYVEEWNEYFGNGMPEEERQRFILWAQAVAEVWATEYRTDPRLSHIRLILANTAIGNDIPLEVAQAAVEWDALLGYHTYWPTRNKAILPEEWNYYSGRWTQMDAQFRAYGLYVNWIFTEGGPIGYETDGSNVWLLPEDGWRSSVVCDGDKTSFLQGIGYFMDRWREWNLGHSWRANPPVLFNSGDANGTWKLFDIRQPEIVDVATLAQDYPMGVDTSPPPPPPPPDGTFEEDTWEESLSWQMIQLNTEAAIQKAIIKDGFIPTGPEWSWDWEGVSYRMQDAEHPVYYERRVYGAKIGDWGNVFWFGNPYLPNSGGLLLTSLPLEAGKFTLGQPFGANPDTYAKYGLDGHEGLDLPCPVGTKVYATAPGEIIQIWEDAQTSNYGFFVRLKHGDRYQTVYAHLSGYAPDLHVGQEVEGGHHLGYSGSTGRSTGPHLHYGVRDWEAGTEGFKWYVDPMAYLGRLLNG